MLVVTANWCTSDGTLASVPPRRFVDRFRAEVLRASLRGGFRRDGSYRPVEGIDVVFAGDTFDWLVSREWTADVRPWDAGRRAAAARERVVLGAIGRSHRLLATLATWMRRGIDVPAADRLGRPMPAETRAVPVRVAMLGGDRDRWLEQAAAGWMLPARAAVIGSCWSDGGVMVRHGDEMDPLHAACSGGPSLGESLAVDMLARFGRSLDDLAGIRHVSAGLVRLLACGPIIDAPMRLVRWLSAHDRGGMLPATSRQGLVDAWHRSVAHWHRAARRLPSDGGDGVDLVGRIAGWLELAGVGEHERSRRWSDPPPSRGTLFLGEPATTVVLGHPAADPGASTAWSRQVVCLGPGALHAGGGRDDDFGAPAAVLVRSGHEGRQIEWLPLDDVACHAGWQDEERPARGVWFSTSPRRDAGIVDAA